MKTFFTLLLFLPNFLFAQGNFTEALFKDMDVRFKQNPTEYIKNETAPNFIFTSSNGQVQNKEEVLTLYSYYDEPYREFSNVVIRQNGSFAYATGILSHAYVHKTTKEKRASKSVITYTFVQEKGKWLFQTGHHTPAPLSVKEEEAAIKKVIEDETQAYIDGDGKKLLSFWAEKKSNEHASQFLVPIIGQPYAKGESMDKLQSIVMPNLKKQNFTVERDDFEVRINNNMAWATYTQKAAANGAVFKTDRETRILERLNGEWKIVYVGEQAMK